MSEKPREADEPVVPKLAATAQTDMSQLYRSKAFPFVRAGSVYAFSLREHLAEPAIPPGESAICALAAVDTGLTYGISCGARGHLFYFHPAFGVVHIGLLGEGPVEGGALVDVGNSRLIGGWYDPGVGGLFCHSTDGETGQGLEQFRGPVTPVEPIDVPVPGEGVVALAHDARTGAVYGLAMPSGALFTLNHDAQQTRVLARIEAAAPALVALPNGNVLGAYADGQLWEYRVAESRLVSLDAHAPCQMGKRYVAGVQSLVLSSTGIVYGGTSTDGFLFSFDPDTGEILNVGKPNRQSNIRALVEGHDGTIYGVVEEPQGMAHLFAFDPRQRGFTDLGVLGASFPDHWIAHSLGSMSVGPFGEIFIGETDNISHLFIYYPPIPRGVGRA